MKKIIFSIIVLLAAWQISFAQELVSQGKRSWASSLDHDWTVASDGNDGDSKTRFGSGHKDDAWWTVDLGQEYHVSRVEIDWEGAFGKKYQIQLSNDEEFKSFEIIADITNGKGGQVVHPTDLNKKGRYVRMQGVERGTEHGYSFWEFRAYGLDELREVPVKMEVPNVEYLKVKLTPADLTGKSEIEIKNESKVIDLKYNVGSPLKVELLDVKGNFIVDFYTLKEGSDTEQIKGSPLDVIVYENMVVGVELTPGIPIDKGLVSQGKTSWASSLDHEWTDAMGGNDGDTETRFGSGHEDNAWWTVDLGREYHISRVEIDWEGAFGKKYQIQISNDKDFNDFEIIADITNGQGGEEVIPTDLNKKGRYLRMQGIERGTEHGYSFWEFRAYGIDELKQVPIKMEVPYVQYLKVRLTPADLTGKSELIVQNKDEVIDLSYNEGSPLKIDLLDFRGNFDIDFFTLKEGTETDSIKGVPLSTTVYENMIVGVKLTPIITFGNQTPVADAGPDIQAYSPVNEVELDGSKSIDRDGEIISYGWEQISGPADAVFTSPNSAKTTATGLVLGDYKFRLTVVDNENAIVTDDINVSILPPEQIDFLLSSPDNGSMIIDTRRPVLRWQECEGATNYEIFVNITRNDYEWYASGNLLDRYTKVGDATTNSFTMDQDLVDRWTYKWYVIATTADGLKFSDKKQFGLYIPHIEQHDDGIDIIDGCRDMNKNGTIEPFEDWRLTPEERLNDIMGRLTIEEKLSQLFYGGNDNPLDGFAFSYGVENGMRDAQYAASKTRMGLPVAFLGDKMHGWKTIYPTQLGLAATRDMNLAYQCANLHRIEQKSFGFTGTLAPLAEVGTKVLYPRLQEGGGENADDVAAMIRAMICGMQGGPEVNPHSMISTVKHWAGQGAGGEGPTQYDEVTIKYHMKPWYAAVDANAISVMPGYSTSPFLDPSNAGANESKLIINYLRNEIGYKGFIVTDWLAANTEQSIKSIGAGIDVLGGAPSKSDQAGVGTDFDELIAAVGMERLDDAVSRVLDMKIRMGMFENPYDDPTCTWTNEKHHDIVLNAARKSITLLTNDNVLPLKMNAGEKLLVAGQRRTWENQHDDPNVIWQSIYYDNPQAKKYLQAIEERGSKDGIIVLDNEGEAGTAIVVIGENSYTHGTDWDDKNPNIPEEQLSVIRDLHDKGVKVITVVILPRPYVLTPVVELSDAVMVVYRGGNGIGQAVAECIFGDFAPSGKLPFQLPRSQEQVGVDNLDIYHSNTATERWELPYDIGATEAHRAQIREKIANDEQVPAIFGNPLFHYGFGIQGFGVDDDTPPLSFDLLTPENDYSTDKNSVTFTWERSSDPESAIAYYEVYIDGSARAQVTTTNYTENLLDLGAHTWFVKAVNGWGLEQNSTSTRSFTVAGSGITEQQDGGIVIYPNPVKENLFIKIKDFDEALSLKIIDTTGRIVVENQIKYSDSSIDMSGFNTGVYYLIIKGEKEVKTFKLLKK
ncbi:discoidin domain-containing protein [Dysgonomonas sp. 520]|uniref:galactose-binding domain-containing protein n=1 Tax=Dysgonomonas sp. 520 TaxID=2302931 RepID=UPI0013D3B962|nr:discoidin domain-containing protein [Dysgonomonas sp. 520]NDW10777.1 T9SS C-terminal target domain-containing protein [Dysgonomonas sp. 520]